MKIIGNTKDQKSKTDIIFAQVSPSEYLDMVGTQFGGFSIQRKRESHKAYARLKEDIRQGASLPTITLALKPEFVDEALSEIGDSDRLASFLSQPERSNILDGLQRTYILDDLRKESFEFHPDQKLLLEIWLEKDLQKLIYRIIVLNAGQKPMSARHQIELLFASLQKSIEDTVGDIQLATEKDQTKRRKSRKFPLQVIISGYQAFASGATELNKDNLISQKLQIDTALDMDEANIKAQFDEFIENLKIYAELDEEVFRIYSPNQEAEAEAEADTEKASIATPHWLTNENTCISFFAAISQYSSSDDTNISTAKKNRANNALNKLIKKLKVAEIGSDPLNLREFEEIRRGKNARKINIGTYTRRLLANGLKEFFREEGDIELSHAWNLAAD